MNGHSCHDFKWFARIIPFFLKFSPGSENSTILSFAGIVIKKKKKELGSPPHLCDPTLCLIICFFCIIDLLDFCVFPVSENYTGLIDSWWCILQSAFNAPLNDQALQIYWESWLCSVGCFCPVNGFWLCLSADWTAADDYCHCFGAAVKTNQAVKYLSIWWIHAWGWTG